MNVPVWGKPADQFCKLSNHHWSVARLIQLSADLPVMEIPLEHLNIYHRYKSLSLLDFAMHANAALKANLNNPIILDEEGELMDGRHRIIKCLIRGKETIKAVRFEVNPPPCKVED